MTDDVARRPWGHRSLWAFALVAALLVAVSMAAVVGVFLHWAITGYWGPEQPDPWRDVAVAVGLWIGSIALVWALRPVRAVRRMLRRRKRTTAEVDASAGAAQG